jgi:hypothetical protein
MPASNVSHTNCNAVLPPARDPRPHRRPSIRRAEDARSMLRRLQIVDPADAETLLCLRRNLRPGIAHRTVEKGVPGSFRFSRSPHTQSLHSRPFARHRCRCGCGWLNPHLSQYHVFHGPTQAEHFNRIVLDTNDRVRTDCFYCLITSRQQEAGSNFFPTVLAGPDFCVYLRSTLAHTYPSRSHSTCISSHVTMPFKMHKNNITSHADVTASHIRLA